MDGLATKLEKLLIEEVSGVDAPANQLDGWMVAKSKLRERGIGPDQEWDAAAAEKRVRAATGASDAPNAEYASCFLWSDSDGPDQFGAYKFLVADVVDGELKVMPQALRVAADRLPGSGLSDLDKSDVGQTLEKLATRAGAKLAEKSAPEATSTTLERIKGLLFPARKDDIDMTSEELKAALDERDIVLVEKFAEVVKSVAPVEGAPEATPAPEPPAPAAPAPETEATGLSADDVVKAIQEALKPYNEILEKVIDRFEPIERALGVAARRSLEGQETGGDPPTPEDKPVTKSAIATLLERPIGSSIGSVAR